MIKSLVLQIVLLDFGELCFINPTSRNIGCKKGLIGRISICSFYNRLSPIAAVVTGWAVTSVYDKLSHKQLLYKLGRHVSKLS